MTVVIPVYNHEQYIERAIESVFSQTYTSVELVVIDDGSVDGSVERLKELRKRWDFTLICQENQGVCKALNRAIREAAHGRYLALLGSDDYWDVDKLRAQMEAMQEDKGSEFCFSQAIQFADGSDPSEGGVFPRRCATGNVVEKVFVRQHVPAGTMLFSRDLYDRLNGFDENLREEDWDFVIRCAAVTRFTAVPRPLLYYRVHASNSMRTRAPEAIFHQKLLVLAKNFREVSPTRAMLSIMIHFVHDILLRRAVKV